jgi:hypothetical protein
MLPFKGWKMGFEPTTNGTTIRYSNLLSYIHHFLVRKDINFIFSFTRLGKKYSIFLPAIGNKQGD